MFDVVIVGAGPGGSTTAKFLGDMGLEVCLIDKATFPRDKPCGGGFSPAIFEKFPYLEKRKDEFLDRILNIGVLHSPSRRITLKGQVKMAVALRSKFDTALFEEAHDAGVQCMTGKRIKQVSVSKDSVDAFTDDGNVVSGRFVIGADGVNSVVARETGLNTKWAQDRITACRVAEIPASEEEITDLYAEEGEYHFFANLHGAPGYGWIFPKIHTINVGVGIKANHARSMQSVFNAFVGYLIKHGLLPTGIDVASSRGAIVPTGGPIESFVHNRCLLVGDSAGMVNPLTGGGILYAMEAGKIAAHIIQRCIDEGALNKKHLKSYQRKWEQSNGKDMASMLMAQKVFTSFLTETFFKIGEKDESIQHMVSNAMSESEMSSVNIPKLLGRAALVCLKQALPLM